MECGDPKRARFLAQAILERAGETGLLQDSELKDGAGPADALRQLDAWLCDLKDMRIADGLHVFGQSPEASLQSDTYKKSVRPNRATSSSQVGTWVTSSLVLPDSTRYATGTAPSADAVKIHSSWRRSGR